MLCIYTKTVGAFIQCSCNYFRVIVDKKENKLRKGSGFHLDMLVLGFIALINGFLGVPFVLLVRDQSWRES